MAPPDRDDLPMPEKGSIEIAEQANAAITGLASASKDGRETGGILLGRGPDANGVIHVEIAGDPGPAAERRPDFFLRDLGHARELAEEAWNTSQAIWVGEWHTHPLGGRAPSPSDLHTYATLLSAADLDFKLFVAIIVIPGKEGEWDNSELCPWLLRLC